jgi:predicted MFS family arabinose efflux permease
VKTPPRWHILVLTLVRIVYNTLHRMVYPFLSAFARGVGVDLTTISYALTLRSAIGTVGPFAAALSDRWGRKAGMLSGAALFTLGAGLVVLWPTYTGLILSIPPCWPTWATASPMSSAAARSPSPSSAGRWPSSWASQRSAS